MHTRDSSHCLKMTQYVAFEVWHFPPIFVLLKLTCLVTLFYHKLQVFQTRQNGPFLPFLMTFVHSKCKRSSLRTQRWMRPFLWFLHNLFFKVVKVMYILPYKSVYVNLFKFNANLLSNKVKVKNTCDFFHFPYEMSLNNNTRQKQSQVSSTYYYVTHEPSPSSVDFMVP